MLSSIPLSRPFSHRAAVNVLKRATLAIALLFVQQAPLIASELEESSESSGRAETRQRAIEHEREYERTVQKDEAEREAAEYQRLANERESAKLASLVEAEAAERARQAKEAEQRQVISEAAIRRKAQEGRAPEYKAFNLAYNDFLNGNFAGAAIAFRQFVKDYPATTLTGNAHYWLGESYYRKHDYVQAIKAFEYVSNEYPANEKVPASLFKLGLAAKEIGDADKSKKSFRRVIEEFPSSDAAKLAKDKLADFR